MLFIINQIQIAPSELLFQFAHENPKFHLGLIQYALSALFQDNVKVKNIYYLD